MAKQRKIFLIDFTNFCVDGGRRSKAPYQVEKLINSNEFTIGEYLDSIKVKDLCDVTDYEVAIRIPKDADFGSLD